MKILKRVIFGETKTFADDLLIDLEGLDESITTTITRQSIIDAEMIRSLITGGYNCLYKIYVKKKD